MIFLLWHMCSIGLLLRQAAHDAGASAVPNWKKTPRRHKRDRFAGIFARDLPIGIGAKIQTILPVMSRGEVPKQSQKDSSGFSCFGWITKYIPITSGLYSLLWFMIHDFLSIPIKMGWNSPKDTIWVPHGTQISNPFSHKQHHRQHSGDRRLWGNRHHRSQQNVFFLSFCRGYWELTEGKWLVSAVRTWWCYGALNINKWE